MRSRVTSTLSEVKLRSDVVISRTSRSKTISSIGRRSYETIAESMIARMPELSVIDTSVMLKPRSVSISSWLRMRSARSFELGVNELVSSIMAAHWAAISSLTVSTGAAADSGAAASSSRAAPHSAANASWSTCASAAIVRPPSLDDDLLEQHGVHLAGRYRHVDPTGEFLLEAVEPGRSVEVGRPQLAQVGLERVHD